MSSYVSLNLRMCAAKPDKVMEDVILNLGWEDYSASKATDYARKILKGRWIKAEKKIKKVPYQAYLYARHVIGGRWPEAEKIIATNSYSSYLYAKYVLEDRFMLAERKKIWETPRDIFLYSKYVLKGRWKNKEKILLMCMDNNGPYFYGLEDTINYAIKIRKERWREIEPAVVKTGYISKYYDFLKNKEDKEEFYNMILAESLMETKKYHINYAEQFIKKLA